MLVISLMALLAAGTLRNPFLQIVAVNCFIPGAVLFILSDAALAMNKFLLRQPRIDILVMLTYGAAQYCLVSGFIKLRSAEV
jgi:uncharacterized membrane protein YhhN